MNCEIFLSKLLDIGAYFEKEHKDLDCISPRITMHNPIICLFYIFLGKDDETIEQSYNYLASKIIFFRIIIDC